MRLSDPEFSACVYHSRRVFQPLCRTASTLHSIHVSHSYRLSEFLLLKQLDSQLVQVQEKSPVPVMTPNRVAPWTSQVQRTPFSPSASPPPGKLRDSELEQRVTELDDQHLSPEATPKQKAPKQQSPNSSPRAVPRLAAVRKQLQDQEQEFFEQLADAAVVGFLLHPLIQPPSYTATLVHNPVESCIGYTACPFFCWCA